MILCKLIQIQKVVFKDNLLQLLKSQMNGKFQNETKQVQMSNYYKVKLFIIWIQIMKYPGRTVTIDRESQYVTKVDGIGVMGLEEQP